MAGRASIDFRELREVVEKYDRRARRVFGEVAPAASEAMHAQVLEVFDTEGFGRWPRFAWERRGEPPPGTPMGVRAGPATPGQNAARERKARREAALKSRAKEERKRQKKLNAALGFGLGAFNRRYAAPSPVQPTRGRAKKTKRKPSAATRRYYRRMQGSPKLLQDTGNLVGSVTPFHDEDLIEVFTNVPYAKYHISPAPRRVIPLRDFFDIDMDAFEADVVSMILLRITDETASAAE